MRSRTQAIAATVSVLIAAAGCQVTPARTGSDATPLPVGGVSAATRLAETRCDHEVACGNVGAGRYYETRALCLADMTQSAGTDLAQSVCPIGVDSNRLSRCIEQFRRESCRPLATIGRMTACSASTMCLRSSDERFSGTEVYGQ
jgi:hypothetical protein